MAKYNNAGSKFNRDLDIKDIAKALRRDIKAMQKRGLFADMKVSVRISRYSLGQSLNIRITEWAGDINNAEFVAANNWNSDIPRYAPRAAKVLQVLRRLGAAWNYNNSDSMVDYYDVNYHLSVEFDTGLANADWAAKRAA